MKMFQGVGTRGMKGAVHWPESGLFECLVVMLPNCTPIMTDIC